jgi:hypothetical protein
MINCMNIAVSDANGILFATGVITEMGSLFSTPIPQEIQLGFNRYIAENPQMQAGVWEAQADGKSYIIRFSN